MQTNDILSEKEKMIAGLAYYPTKDDNLSNDRLKCKILCQKYNTLSYDDTSKDEILNQIIGKMGKILGVEPCFWCDYGYNIEIGDGFYSNHNLTILDCAKVKFGKNVLIGPNCSFYTAIHPINAKERNSLLEYAKPIAIEDNVWIGGSVTVLPDVTIGKNSVIGAGSVVTKNIPKNVIAVGNPCKVIKTIDEGEEKS